MFARITAVFGERDNARVVPEEAIVPQGGRQFVIRLVDGPDQDTKLAQRVEVKVGIRRPGRVEITDGLKAGDLVVTAGQQRVQRDGMPVRVVDLNRATSGAQPGTPAAEAGGAAAGSAAASGPVAVNGFASGNGLPPPSGAGISARLAAPKLDGPNPCLMASAQPGSRNPAGGDGAPPVKR
jgi:membrane fusion protein, multidrug efflux system